MEYTERIIRQEIERAEREVARLSDEISRLATETARQIETRDYLLDGIKDLRRHLEVRSDG